MTGNGILPTYAWKSRAMLQDCSSGINQVSPLYVNDVVGPKVGCTPGLETKRDFGISCTGSDYENSASLGVHICLCLTI